MWSVCMRKRCSGRSLHQMTQPLPTCHPANAMKSSAWRKKRAKITSWLLQVSGLSGLCQSSFKMQTEKNFVGRWAWAYQVSLEKPVIMHSTPSLRRFAYGALETIPIFIWLILSRKIVLHLALLLSTPCSPSDQWCDVPPDILYTQVCLHIVCVLSCSACHFVCQCL